MLIRITDFGESRKGLDQTDSMTMTRGIGTPFYMAPEMLRGDDQYTRAVDAYSFGIMCAELWNERQPYNQFTSVFQFISYVVEGNRPEIKEDCPKELVELMSHCWASDRHERDSFANIVKELCLIVQNIKQSMPSNTEHVKDPFVEA